MKNFLQKHKRISIIISLFVIAVSIAITYKHLSNESKRQKFSNYIYPQIAKELKKNINELTNKDLKKVKKLTLDKMETGDMHLLAELTNLEELDITVIRVTKISIPKWKEILAKLGIYKLQKANLTVNRADLTPLAKLTKLKKLSIFSYLVNDITPLSNLTSLNELVLRDIATSDLKPIGKLINLQKLLLSTAIKLDYEPLKELKNLKRLEIGHKKITDEQVEDLQKALPELEIIR
jgi:internalin A